MFAKLFNKKQYDVELGLLTEKSCLLPGVAIDCTCSAKSIIHGLDD